jgi:hypothetical protein
VDHDSDDTITVPEFLMQELVRYKKSEVNKVMEEMIINTIICV